MSEAKRFVGFFLGAFIGMFGMHMVLNSVFGTRSQPAQ
jgi:hypothetical protein